MAQDKSNVSRFSGEYLIQDQDHMSDSQSGAASRSNRQAEQGQSSARQQGGSDQHATGQQGASRSRRSK